MGTWPILGMADEKSFIVDMRKSSVIGIWKGPDWQGHRRTGGEKETEKERDKQR